MVLGIFKVALRFWDRHVFMWQSLKILNVFNTSTLKQISKKKETFFKKLEYCIFFFESTKIENVIFWYKTALPVANIKTNGMGSAKWTYHREWSFASKYFIFWRFRFSWKTSYKELMYELPKCSYLYFSLALEIHFSVFFLCVYP